MTAHSSFLMRIVQFALFQAAWFACVLSAAHGRAELGVLAVSIQVLITWWLSPARSMELKVTLLAILVGLVWDTAMLQAGWVRYASPGPLPHVAPVWILALWALFATLLCGPLAWLHGRPWLAAALGAVGGPMSYLAAVRLGAGSFGEPVTAMVVLALGWAVMTPVLTSAASRLGQPLADQRKERFTLA